ncbi:MAG: helix-turn-helix transcriptional regulator [Ruminococcus sp.]|nr:helix-turn-helix transcriptional regulator [Ruminococcus sp.]
MNDLKSVIADNITQLRRSKGMTQAELAEKLNYTDKAVSKWERRESLPDITVLKAIADCFGVSVDYLISAEHKASAAEEKLPENTVQDFSSKNRGFITGMSIMLVWLVACIAFVIINAIDKSSDVHWLSVIYAVPASLIVWLVLNSVWFNVHRNFLIVSLLMWSLLLAVYLTLLIAGANMPLLFLTGLPGQAIIMLWSGIRTGRKH